MHNAADEVFRVISMCQNGEKNVPKNELNGLL